MDDNVIALPVLSIKIEVIVPLNLIFFYERKLYIKRLRTAVKSMKFYFTSELYEQAAVL
jgi:hypothetical protein